MLIGLSDASAFGSRLQLTSLNLILIGVSDAAVAGLPKVLASLFNHNEYFNASISSLTIKKMKSSLINLH